MLAEQFHRLRERRGQALAWAKASEAAGMNYAFTVNPDVYSVPGRSPGGVINCLCKELFQELNVCLRGLSRRQAQREARLDFLGVYELRDRRELVYPHGHFAIRLEQEDIFWLEMFMDERWGMRIGDDVHPPTGKPLSPLLGKRAQWDLRPISKTGGWANYVHKCVEEQVMDFQVFPLQFVRRDSL
jgi:hypothetical protein